MVSKKNIYMKKCLFSIDLDFAMWIGRAANLVLQGLSKDRIRKTYQICGKQSQNK